jgi:hypothetical protein
LTQWYHSAAHDGCRGCQARKNFILAREYTSNRMDEQKLSEKLRRIEALYAGATTSGERTAAANARERIRERLRAQQSKDDAVEYRFSMTDVWSRKLFLGLLRRYDLKPYRYRGQRHTTVMVRVPKSFVDETLWPEFRELSETLRAYLDEVTERVIQAEIYGDSSDAEIRAEPLRLEAGFMPQETPMTEINSATSDF